MFNNAVCPEKKTVAIRENQKFVEKKSSNFLCLYDKHI